MNKYTLLLFIFLILACNTNENGESNSFAAENQTVSPHQFDEEHPHPEYMPYTEREAQLLEVKDDISAVELPQPLILLKDFLEDDQGFTVTDLSFLVSDKDRFYAESLSSNQLLLLDVRQHRLVHYDVDEGVYNILAPQGRGPGDILFAEEIQLIDHKLYIPMGGFRVSVFECENEKCEYLRTINTELNNYSVARNNNHLAILSQPMYTGRDEDKDSFYESENSVIVIDSNGEVKQSFMPIYDHPNPILRGRFSGEGSLRSFGQSEIYTVILSRLPYLFLFDHGTADLIEKYKFPDYRQGFIDIETDTPLGASRERHNDQSYFTHSTRIDDDWLLITKRERRNTDTEMRGMDADESYIYYGFNTNSHTLHKIGKEPFLPMDEQRTLTVTDHGLVINREGSVYWVGL